MIRQMECQNCGQFNNIDTESFAQAICGTCKSKFSEDVELSVYKSEQELATALATDHAYSKDEKIDTKTWIAKIGDSNEQEKYVKDNFLKKLKKHASKIPFAKDALAMYYCAIDIKTPMKAKAIAIGALAYVVLPIDLIPDFILILGYTDDAAAFWVAFNSINTHITDEHRKQAEDFFN
ncbi:MULTISPECIES: YkvA family protein [Paenibacillus]|uniref:YkvA family protein n=1 Tax=Paenibacillus urinalis TaxID=521520 RepID=A0AAX3N1Z9_9BACL|nr:YkvA family protein [Paenibacillus urinalis]WDH83371.1 YkvA family protein [Paenibacillus urinalis]